MPQGFSANRVRRLSMYKSALTLISPLLSHERDVCHQFLFPTSPDLGKRACEASAFRCQFDPSVTDLHSRDLRSPFTQSYTSMPLLQFPSTISSLSAHSITSKNSSLLFGRNELKTALGTPHSPFTTNPSLIMPTRGSSRTSIPPPRI